MPGGDVGGSSSGSGSDGGGPAWRHGPILLFGRSADLVAALAEQAVATEGAGLEGVSDAGKLLKNVVAAGWADASTVHTFVLEEGCDTDAVSRAIRGALATAPVCHPGALASVVYVRRSDEPREQWAVRVPHPPVNVDPPMQAHALGFAHLCRSPLLFRLA